MEHIKSSNLIKFNRLDKRNKTLSSELTGAIIGIRVVDSELLFFVWQGNHKGHFIHLVKLNGMFSNEFISHDLLSIDYKEKTDKIEDLYSSIADKLIEKYKGEES